jgi:hypothetical protein
MVKTAKCKICGAADDTWEHALIKCTMSRCVWAQLDEDIIELITTLHIADPMYWVLFVYQYSTGVGHSNPSDMLGNMVCEKESHS